MCIYPDWDPKPAKGTTCMDMSLQEMFAKANAIKPLLSIAPLEQQLIEMDAPTESKSML